MKLPKELTTVTTLSKTMALIIVVTTPIIGFLLGVKYQKKADQLYSQGDNLAQSQDRNATGEIEFSSGIVIYNFTDKSANQDILKLIEMRTILPPTDKKFKNNEEAVKEIVAYNASSTSQYLSPELNKISQLSQSTVTVEDSANNTLPVYRYEINWEIDPNAGTYDKGTDVWHFIPLSKDGTLLNSTKSNLLEDDSTYLWLSYDKENEDKLSPILDSLTLKIQ